MLSPLPGDIFRTGQVLNNTYEIEGILGRGGTGEVYRARNQVNDRIVALKALNREFSRDEGYLELMKREEEMRSIMHPAVVRYSENSRTEDGHVFLVMDYVEGPSLNEKLLRGGQEVRDLLVVGHRVAEGLVATHAHGIVHRDLSPDNIILKGGDPAEAVIIDFGIAKDTSIGARTIVGNDFAGKYEYAAPEQVEGKAEARSDLYALGASLLAAYRGEIPFQRSTPGEMVRRKHSPLDSQGVPEPLKGVIDWLTAPELDARPRDAAEVVERLERILKIPGKTRDRGRSKAKVSGPKPKRGGGLKLVLGVAVLAILAIGGWLLRGMIEPEVPVIETYLLTASSDGAFSANAPDEDGAAKLRGAYSLLSGQLAPEGAIEIGQGMPSENWVDIGAALLGALAGLDEWRIEVEDSRVRVTGTAQDKATRDLVRGSVDGIARQGGMSASSEIVAGPLLLPRENVQRMLNGTADCGRLEQAGSEDPYPLGATIAVTGNLAVRETEAELRDRLEPAIGDRTLRLDTTVLNDDLCAIRAVLPPVPSGDVSIRMSFGNTGEPNATGIFQTEQNPVVDILLPAGVTEGSLWVMIIDNSGKVFHILPNISRKEHLIGNLGTVEGGIRRIRVLFSRAEAKTDPSLMAMKVNAGEYGKSEVVAILTDRQLFDSLRPREESTEAVTEALSDIIVSGDVNIRAVATRIIDTRP